MKKEIISVLSGLAGAAIGAIAAAVTVGRSTHAEMDRDRKSVV